MKKKSLKKYLFFVIKGLLRKHHFTCYTPIANKGNSSLCPNCLRY